MPKAQSEHYSRKNSPFGIIRIRRPDLLQKRFKDLDLPVFQFGNAVPADINLRSEEEQTLELNRRCGEIFTQIVSIPSETGKTEKMGEYIVSFFKQDIFEGTGLEIDTDRNKVITVKMPGNGIGLNHEARGVCGHYDTVGDDTNVEVYKDEQGFIRSRNQTTMPADNKINVAWMLTLAEYFAKSNTDHRPMEWIFSPDEEGHALGMREYDYRKLKSKFIVIFDFAEKFGLIALSQTGYYALDFLLSGEAGHPNSDETYSAALPLLFLLIKSAPLLIRRGRKLRFNIGKIVLGEGRNTVPGKGIVQAEMRFTNKEIAERKIAKLGRISHIEVDSRLENDSYKHSKNAPIIEIATKILREMGESPKLVHTASVSDACNMQGKVNGNNEAISALVLADSVLDAHNRNQRFLETDGFKIGKFLRIWLTDF